MAIGLGGQIGRSFAWCVHGLNMSRAYVQEIRFLDHAGHDLLHAAATRASYSLRKASISRWMSSASSLLTTTLAFGRKCSAKSKHLRSWLMAWAPASLPIFSRLATLLIGLPNTASDRALTAPLFAGRLQLVRPNFGVLRCKGGALQGLSYVMA